MKTLAAGAVTLAVLGFAALPTAQDRGAVQAPFRPPVSFTAEPAAPPIAKEIVDDRRRGRNCPEQPPVIPHDIVGYQLTLNNNRGRAMKLPGFLLRAWRTMSRPAGQLSLGFLTLGGFVAGVIFWGGFNTALEVTIREAFCIDCHKGIAHRLPDMRGVPPGWTEATAFNDLTMITPPHATPLRQ